MTQSSHCTTQGFNLLPWRHREARSLRRRLALQWVAAALLGCACVAPFAGWRAWQRVQFEREHRALTRALDRLRAPLAEERRLVHDEQERRRRDAEARERAKPLARLFSLLDRLGAANVEGVTLRQVVHREHETEVQATVDGEAATAVWLARLRALPEVGAVSVREMKRAAAGGGRDIERQHGPLQVIAHLAWAGPAASDAQPAASLPPPAGTVRARSGE